MGVFTANITELTAENLNKFVAGGSYDTGELRICAGISSGGTNPTLINIAGLQSVVWNDPYAGDYTVYFSSNFSSIPAVIAIPLFTQTVLSLTLYEVAPSYVRLKISNLTGGGVNAAFHLLVIGK